MARIGLRGEILGVFALVTLFAIGLNTAVVWQLDALLLRQERIDQARTTALLTGAVLDHPLSIVEAQRIRPQVAGLEEIAFFDPNGLPVSVVPDRGTELPQADVQAALHLGDASAVALGAPAHGLQRIRVAAPIGDPAHPAGAMVLWLAVGSADPSHRNRQLEFLYIALDALLAGALAWYLVSRSVLRPLWRVAEATRRLAGGDLSARAQVAAANEVGDIARDFNRMTEALAGKDAALARQLRELQEANVSLRAAREEVVQSEKLASVGRLAAGVAHELGNPVGAVTGYVSALLRDPAKQDPEDTEMLRRVDREMKRIDRIIRDLLDYARPRAANPEPLDPEEIVEGAIAIVSVQKAFKQLALVRKKGAPPKVTGDRHRLQQVIVNLLINAADAVESSAERRITVETSLSSFPPAPEGRRRDDPPMPSGPAVSIRVSDTGVGINPANLPLLFDPFFTTKPPGRGTGLGLSIAKQIVESLSGRLLVESAPGKGAVFTVLLPPVAT